MRAQIKTFSLFGIVVLGWAATAGARDWPQWGGTATRNMFSLERGIPVSFDPGKKGSDGSGIDLRTTQNVRWAARLGSENYSSPAIAGGKVFIGTNDSDLADPRFQQTGGGVLLCLDEATGRRLWRLVVPRLTTGRKSSDFDDMDLGICSSPAVDGDRVYVVTNRNEVLCLDANGMANGNDGPFLDERHYEVPAGHPPVEPGPQDADIIWRFDINSLPVFPHDAAASSVLVFGDAVFVGTGNGIDNKTHPMPAAPSLIALDKRTGRLLAADNEQIGGRVFHGQWSSPSLGWVGNRPLVFFGAGDGVCYAFDAAAADRRAAPGFCTESGLTTARPPIAWTVAARPSTTGAATAASTAETWTTAGSFRPARSSARPCSTRIAFTWRSGRIRSMAVAAAC